MLASSKFAKPIMVGQTVKPANVFKRFTVIITDGDIS